MSSPAWKSIASATRPATADEVRELRRTATVRCNKGISRRQTNCNPAVTNMACLFNIYTYPCEENDLSTTNADIAMKMYTVLLRHRQFLIPQLNKPWDIAGADPTKFNDTWTCWLDWMSSVIHKYVGNISQVCIRCCGSNKEQLAVTVSCERRNKKRSVHVYTGFLICSVSFTSFILFEIMVDLVHQSIHTSFPKDNNQSETTHIKTFIVSFFHSHPVYF